ncbi:helix-turn-helix transcriptional regulator [Nodosilinea sp. LEGE 07088]|uniref:AraC family transcriptional regulator n=1 Tax=Nodosilinea sp. LEGE 07088 TaxID=2777968 RepID=UPI00187E8636|nr:AraC family transcriptional regulator [Nodosilinea sp. LEGE 07088]MBE9137014.1 helix-turn-helix transcriptional regulator [Nodosilinea sp. LEGE 07088]
MAKENLVRFDFSREKEFSRVLGRPCLLSSYQTCWQGIGLEVYRHPPFETPKCTVLQHMITIPQGGALCIEEISGKKVQVAEFHPGSISFEPQGMPRQYRWHQEMETIHITLEPEYVHQAIHETIDPEKVELTAQFGQSDPLVYQMGLALTRELANNPDGDSLYAESVATLLSVHLLRYYSTQKKIIKAYANGLPDSKIKTATDYINTHLTQAISLESISSQLGMSRYYFCRLFKQSMGISPYQYILQQRVEYAKSLLRHGKLSISEVAIESGFSHHSHFDYHFKRIVHCTPKQFLKI